MSNNRLPEDIIILLESGSLVDIIEYNEKHNFLDKTTEDGRTSFYIACSAGWLDVAKWIYKMCDSIIFIPTEKNMTPFYIACYNGHFEIVKWIYEINKNDLQITSKHGNTPFIATCYKGHIEIAKWIHNLDKKQISFANIDKFTPLYIASLYGHIDIVKWIYEQSPEQISIVNLNECTPLYAACWYGHIDVAQFIYNIDNKQISTKQNSGYDPIYAASVQGFLKIVKWISKTIPVDFNLKYKNGHNCFTAACEHNYDHFEIAEYIHSVTKLDENQKNIFEINETKLDDIFFATYKKSDESPKALKYLKWFIKKTILYNSNVSYIYLYCLLQKYKTIEEKFGVINEMQIEINSNLVESMFKPELIHSYRKTSEKYEIIKLTNETTPTILEVLLNYKVIPSDKLVNNIIDCICLQQTIYHHYPSYESTLQFINTPDGVTPSNVIDASPIFIVITNFGYLISVDQICKMIRMKIKLNFLDNEMLLNPEIYKVQQRIGFAIYIAPFKLDINTLRNKCLSYINITELKRLCQVITPDKECLINLISSGYATDKIINYLVNNHKIDIDNDVYKHVISGKIYGKARRLLISYHEKFLSIT